MLIQLRALLNTAGKDLMEVGQRPHWGWAYHEYKAEECLKMAKRIDRIIKNKNKKRNYDKVQDKDRAEVCERL